MIQTISPYKIEFLQVLQPKRKQFVRFTSRKTAQKTPIRFVFRFFYNPAPVSGPNTKKFPRIRMHGNLSIVYTKLPCTSACH